MLSISKAMTVGTGELVGERRAPTIYVSSLVSFLLYLNVFLFTGLVSGSFEIVKLIFFVFFTLSAVLLSLLEGVKFKYLTLVLFLFLALVFVVHLSYSLVAGNYDQYSLVQFRNIIFVK